MQLKNEHIILSTLTVLCKKGSFANGLYLSALPSFDRLSSSGIRFSCKPFETAASRHLSSITDKHGSFLSVPLCGPDNERTEQRGGSVSQHAALICRSTAITAGVMITQSFRLFVVRIGIKC